MLAWCLKWRWPAAGMLYLTGVLLLKSSTVSATTPSLQRAHCHAHAAELPADRCLSYYSAAALLPDESANSVN